MQASVRWLVQGGYAYHASWSPDGRRVVFAWQPDASKLTQIYLLEVDSNKPPQLLPSLDTTHHNVNPDWSPDGKTIVFSSPAPLSTADHGEEL
jgi:Tol biopolymer transport system component